MVTNGKPKRGRGVRALIPDPAPKLAEGTQLGVKSDPTMAVFVATIDAGNVLRAELGLATALLRQLERVLTRDGGYMAPEDQDALRAARAFLVDRAK